MSLAMSKEERESFLAAKRIGVISFNEPGRGPLSAPIWYAYEPGGEPWVLIGTNSRKAKLVSEGVRISMVVQQEEFPYSYVSVEGVASVRPVKDGEVATMATRYLGDKLGAEYAAQSSEENLVVSLRIERWLTVDYAKMGAA